MKYILFSFLSILIFNSTAQKNQFSVKFGIRYDYHFFKPLENNVRITPEQIQGGLYLDFGYYFSDQIEVCLGAESVPISFSVTSKDPDSTSAGVLVSRKAYLAYLNIPLAIRYTIFNDDIFKITANAGLNYGIKYVAFVENEFQDGNKQRENLTKNKVVSPQIGFSLQYEFKENWNFMLEPQFRYALSSHTDFLKKNASIHMKIGVSRTFNSY